MKKKVESWRVYCIQYLFCSSSNKFSRNVVVFINIFNPHWFIVVDFIIIDAAISSFFWNLNKIVICSSFSQLVCQRFHNATKNRLDSCLNLILYPWQKMKILSPVAAFSTTSSQASIILALNCSVFSTAGCSNRLSSSIWNVKKYTFMFNLCGWSDRLIVHFYFVNGRAKRS